MTRLILLGTLIAALLPAKELSADKRIQHAVNTLAKMAAAKDKGIPRALIGRAPCIVIMPGLLKGAFLFGGEYGRGFASCRTGRMDRACRGEDRRRQFWRPARRVIHGFDHAGCE
jgi:SH3 domain-containing YSC84-like protein 1